MIKTFEKSVGRKLPYEVVGRRAGDVLNLTADPARANKELGWRAERTLEDMCDDLWRWTKGSPMGYRQGAPKEFVDRLRREEEGKEKKNGVTPEGVGSELGLRTTKKVGEKRAAEEATGIEKKVREIGSTEEKVTVEMNGEGKGGV